MDAKDHNEAMAIIVALDHVAADAPQVVVALRDITRTPQIHHLNPSIYTVQWHSVRVLTEELQSPGISRICAELMTYGGANTYSMRQPDAVFPAPFGAGAGGRRERRSVAKQVSTAAEADTGS